MAGSWTSAVTVLLLFRFVYPAHTQLPQWIDALGVA